MIEKYIDPNLLTDNANFTVNEEVRHDFSEEEITKLKEDYFELSNRRDIRDTAMKEFTAMMGSDYSTEDLESLIEGLKGRGYGDVGLKALKLQAKELRQMIVRGYQIRRAKLFAFAYYDMMRMAFYDESGNYVYDRPMKAEEKQMTLQTTATIKELQEKLRTEIMDNEIERLQGLTIMYA